MSLNLVDLSLEWIRSSQRIVAEHDLAHVALPPWAAHGFKAPLRRNPLKPPARPGDTYCVPRFISMGSALLMYRISLFLEHGFKGIGVQQLVGPLFQLWWRSFLKLRFDPGGSIAKTSPQLPGVRIVFCS